MQWEYAANSRLMSASKSDQQILNLSWSPAPLLAHGELAFHFLLSQTLFHFDHK